MIRLCMILIYSKALHPANDPAAEAPPCARVSGRTIFFRSYARPSVTIVGLIFSYQACPFIIAVTGSGRVLVPPLSLTPLLWLRKRNLLLALLLIRSKFSSTPFPVATSTPSLAAAGFGAYFLLQSPLPQRRRGRLGSAGRNPAHPLPLHLLLTP